MSPQPIESVPESDYFKSKRVAVFVDPYSTGCVVAQEMARRGYLLVALWTLGFSEEMKTHIPASCGKMDYFAEITQQSTLEETEKVLREVVKGHDIAACLAGGEAGVDFADVAVQLDADVLIGAVSGHGECSLDGLSNEMERVASV